MRIDLGLDGSQLGLGGAQTLDPRGSAVGQSHALDLKERRQGEGVGGLGAGVEHTLQRPGTVSQGGECVLICSGEVRDGRTLDDADLVGTERHLQVDEHTENLAVH